MIRVGALAGVLTGLALLPASAAAQLGIEGLEAGTSGVKARVAFEYTGPGTADDILVGGTFTADVTSQSAVPGAQCRNENANVAQPVVGCVFDPPGVAPGSTVYIDLATDTPCPEGRGFVVTLRDTDTGATTTLGAPCVAGLGADLGITVKRRPSLPRQTDEFRGTAQSDFEQMDLEIVVTNHGPNTARDAELIVPVPPIIPGRTSVWLPEGNFVFLRPREERGRVRCDDDPRRCSLGSLAPRESRRIVLTVFFSEAGDLVMPLAAMSRTPDPGPKPNRVSYLERLRKLDSKITSTSEDAVSGTANGAAESVWLGVMRSGGGVIPQKLVTVSGSAVGCRWLTRLSIAFRFERGRRCNEPVWLRAKGARRWRLEFTRPLPPGRYTVISSAARGSTAEATFDARDGNRRTFTVR